MRNLFTVQLLDKIINKNKVGLTASVSALMPNGVPDFSIIPLSPSIKQLMNGIDIEGQERYSIDYEKMLTVLCMMITDFCDSQTLAEGKNMNQNQVIECASFLLDECGNFRIEDYVLMFSMAKRGKLKVGNTGKVFDRVDIQLISDFKVNYEAIRLEESEKIMEKEVNEKEFGIDIPKEQKLITESDTKSKSNFDTAMRNFYEMMDRIKKEQEQERQDRQKRFDERKEKIFNDMIDLAEKNGYTGNLINLKNMKPWRFKKKK